MNVVAKFALALVVLALLALATLVVALNMAFGSPSQKTKLLPLEDLKRGGGTAVYAWLIITNPWVWKELIQTGKIDWPKEWARERRLGGSPGDEVSDDVVQA